MTDTIHVRGGWSRGNDDRLPPLARARQAADERREAAQERERAAYLEQIQERNLMCAMDAAVQRGQLVSIAETHRTRGANIGRTHSEILAYASAEQDRQDAMERSKARREMQSLGVDAVAYSEMYSGDVSAPSAAEVAELQERAQKDAQRYAARGRQNHVAAIARGVVQNELAQRDERAILRKWGYPA